MINNAVASTEKLSLAALIGVILRRKVNRTIDIKWLIENEEYARKIIELCREQGLDDLNGYADNLELLMFGKSANPVKPEQKAKPALIKPDFQEDFADTINKNEASDSIAVGQNKYVGRLR